MQIPTFILVLHVMVYGGDGVRNTKEVEFWPSPFLKEEACNRVAQQEIQRRLTEDLGSDSATLFKAFCVRQTLEPISVPII